jgi:hypothetical protein
MQREYEYQTGQIVRHKHYAIALKVLDRKCVIDYLGSEHHVYTLATSTALPTPTLYEVAEFQTFEHELTTLTQNQP